eukprot:CAMPEP_0172821934 /NCGR_PEP_ID=MMETSP1075-20121228/16328_1 /TAXON_ID=2916 /ORGANISM="Ceratium fusus, Strain PA161109" /LENGTH=380 /DNA_ID=CAMNT_0013662867 /DNA_START=15 /DNA_END=1154 /DNA_ORIENTATION=+
MRKNSQFDLKSARVASPRPSFGLAPEGRRSQSARRSASVDLPTGPTVFDHVAVEDAPHVSAGMTSPRSEAMSGKLDAPTGPRRSLSEEIQAAEAEVRRTSLGSRDVPQSARHSLRQASLPSSGGLAAPAETRKSRTHAGESPHDWHKTLRQSGSSQALSSQERTSVSLPPREERRQSQRRSMLSIDPDEEKRNSFAERRSSRRHISMHENEIEPVEASVEEVVATQRAADIMASLGHGDLGLQVHSANNNDDYNAEETEQEPQLGNGPHSPSKRGSCVQSQQEVGVQRNSQDATTSPQAEARPSITVATPSPKEKRQSLQQHLAVTEGEEDHAEAADCRRSHVAFEADGFGIDDAPIHKSPLALEELTPPSTADADTPSK